MNKRNDGGPAFPINDGMLHGPGCGMSLRDYFAGQAMQTLLEHLISTRVYPADADGRIDVDMHVPETSDELIDGSYLTAIVRQSYQVADAMLYERATAPATEGTNQP